MKFKNVYDLIRKLGGCEKMVKEVKKIVQLKKNEDYETFAIRNRKKPIFRLKHYRYYCEAIEYLNELLDNDNLKSITDFYIFIDNSIRIVAELKREERKDENGKK